MAKMTPMMEQYLRIKSDYRNAILFYRLGDFYEMFFEDAVIGSKELDLTLTGRDCGMDERAPMCGVPYHSADSYIQKLVEKGYKVAICEQVEDPKKTKTIVKRDVVRVVTKGTVLDTNMLDESKNNYLMCIYEDDKGFGVSISDVTTGDFLTTEILKSKKKNTSIDLEKDKSYEKRIVDEIAKFSPSEIIANEKFSHSNIVENIFKVKINIYNSWAFEENMAFKRLTEHFGVMNLDGFGINKNSLSVLSAGALLEYLYETQKNSLKHIISLKNYFENKVMNLDISSRKNLELTETIRDKYKKGSLLGVLDNTKTPMGARLLRKWLESPLIDKDKIEIRQDSIEELKNEFIFREELRALINKVNDIERIISKIAYQTANARELISLKNSIQNFPEVKNILKNSKTSLLKRIYGNFDVLDDIFSLIDNSIKDEPPFSVREGGMIKENYNEELDSYHLAKNSGTNWLFELEKEERELTGIKNLKIKFNKIFGYYLEVTNSYKNLVPDRYIRRQTLANAERYTTKELKEIEDKILGADDKIVALEYDLFQNIRNKISTHISRIQNSSKIIANIDVLISLSDAAEKNNYTKPLLNTDGIIDIRDGRHPVVETLIDSDFIPNNTYLDEDSDRLNIITGPNMAGKSTYMRQTALIVLMAQIGSFVPASYANIGIVDRIFTRVGASDDLATGQSTFMVEMAEVANILNNATKNSLLILDEIGRGTSTFDGLSIAWAVLEYIASKDRIGAKTLFATHYHELTELEGKTDGVKNYCVTVKEQGEDIVFLRKIARGGAEYSYGVHVARLAGIPSEVIDRANNILDILNNTRTSKNKVSDLDDTEVFYGKPEKKKDDSRIILNELNSLDIDSLSPREALKALYDLQLKSKQI